jgi:hypothetical protein
MEKVLTSCRTAPRALNQALKRTNAFIWNRYRSLQPSQTNEYYISCLFYISAERDSSNCNARDIPKAVVHRIFVLNRGGPPYKLCVTQEKSVVER